MTSIEQLAMATDSTWSNITECALASDAKRQELIAKVAEAKLVPADASFIVFGSLARNEYTNGSDLDWTLLIDGACNSDHYKVALNIKSLIEKDNKPPGPTALFGTMVFSHELVQLIGGEADSNSNTTRRILLLLESRGLVEQAQVRERVLRSVLKRYLQEDRPYEKAANRVRVPHFLMNDIVRFWRTMAVDYAAKRRDRDHKGWAIRTIKLRMSRKLTFAAGMAMCLRCEVAPPRSLTSTFQNPSDFYAALESYFFEHADRTPLEIIAKFALELGAPATAKKIFDAYNDFLAVLGEQTNREHLDKLCFEDASDDKLFQRTREIGREFEAALIDLFFNTNAELTKAIQKYGVF